MTIQSITARYGSINNNAYFGGIDVPKKRTQLKHKIFNCYFSSLTFCTVNIVGRDSSVGIASRYGLDGSGDRNPVKARFSAPFHTSLVQWVPGLSRG